MKLNKLMAALLAAAVLVAGCGGSKPSSNGAEAPKGGEAAKPAQSAKPAQPTKVKLVRGANEITSLPTLIADKKGFLKEQGLELELVEVGGTARVITAIIAGDAEFGQSSMPTNMAAASKGQNTLGVVNFFDKFTMVGVMNKGALPQGVSAEEFAKKPVKDRILALKGKKVATVGAGGLTEVVTRWLLSYAGLDPEKDVTLVNLPDMPSLIPSLQQKIIDAFVGPPPSPFQVVAEGTAVTFFDGSKGEIADLAQFETTNIITSPAFAAKDPDAVKRFATAYVKAMEWANSNQDEAVKLAQQEFPKLNPNVVKEATVWVIGRMAKGGKFNQDALNTEMKVLIQGKQLSKSIDTKEGTFWSNQFLPK